MTLPVVKYLIEALIVVGLLLLLSKKTRLAGAVMAAGGLIALLFTS